MHFCSGYIAYSTSCFSSVSPDLERGCSVAVDKCAVCEKDFCVTCRNSVTLTSGKNNKHWGTSVFIISQCKSSIYLSPLTNSL